MTMVDEPTLGTGGDPCAPHPRIAQRRLAVAREMARRRLRILVPTAAALSVAALGLVVVHSSLLGARRFRDAGTTEPPDELAAQAGIRPGEPLIDIPLGGAADRLERLPWVATARVTRSWPTGVTIAVTARRGVAAVGDRRGGVAVVDVTGRVLAVVARVPPGLPLVGGAGAAPAPGGWMAGGAGARAGAVPGPALAAALDAPVSPTAGALALAGALASLPRAAGSGRAGPSLRLVALDVGAAGTLSALLGSGPGPAAVTVRFGPDTQLAAKAAALRAFVAAVPLTGVGTIDLSVPTRPTTTGPATRVRP